MSLQIPTGEDLKKLRKSHGLTQKELAKRAGISQSLIARIEAGEVDSRMSTMRKILNSILGTKIEKKALNIMHSPVICVGVKSSIREAVDLMEKHGISQLPIVDEGKVVGSVQEGTLIRNILQSRDPERIFNSRVEEIMDEPFPTVGLNTDVNEILTYFTREKPAVLILDKDKLVGIITKIDLITAIRSGED